jgi:hypothetical protein
MIESGRAVLVLDACLYELILESLDGLTTEQVVTKACGVLPRLDERREFLSRCKGCTLPVVKILVARRIAHALRGFAPVALTQPTS